MITEMPLTHREEEALQALGTGKTDAEIASEMGISINTLKTHLKSLYRKLEVRNRVEAIQQKHVRKS